MTDQVARDVLVVSALRGGAAELVLRAIACENVGGIGKIESTGRVTREGVSDWSMDNFGQLVKEVRLEQVKDDRVAKTLLLRLILGGETGVVLKDVGLLSRCRNFSTTHMAGTDGRAVEYVMPISSKIAVQQPFRLQANLRRAVHTITAFLLEKQMLGLLAWRGRLTEANRERSDRKASHCPRRRRDRLCQFADRSDDLMR